MEKSKNIDPFSLKPTKEKTVEVLASSLAIGTLAVGLFVGLEKFSDQARPISEICAGKTELTIQNETTIRQLAVTMSYKTLVDWRVLTYEITNLNPEIGDKSLEQGQTIVVPDC